MPSLLLHGSTGPAWLALLPLLARSGARSSFWLHYTAVQQFHWFSSGELVKLP